MFFFSFLDTRAGSRFSQVLALVFALTLAVNIAAHPIESSTLAPTEGPTDSYPRQPSALVEPGLKKRTTVNAPKEKPTTSSSSSKKTTPKTTTPKLPSTIEIKKKFHVPAGRTTPLFWSGVKGDIPTIRSKFPKILMDVDCYPANYAHTFDHASASTTFKFQKRYSEVFAKNVPGPDVYVLVPWATGPNPKRVFNSAEWPVLKERHTKGDVKNIWQLNPDNLDEKRLYEPKKSYPQTPALGRREQLEAIDTDNAPWDIHLDDLAEAYKMQQAKEV